jgi:hypothetical protein
MGRCCMLTRLVTRWGVSWSLEVMNIMINKPGEVLLRRFDLRLV